MRENTLRFTESLAQVANGNTAGAHALAEEGIATLDAASEYLQQNELSIDQVERIEEVVKLTIGGLVVKNSSPEAARDLAVSMKRLGFVHKLKSYAVKAASPLGYSIFFQRSGEGFSFQRHITHKIEIFHILSAPPGGYAFVCDHESWNAVHEPQRFQRWLEGAADPALESFRHVPEPGDMIVIDRLNVVHTVIGCALEEFATISTDMVDRLFDQNAGRPMPLEFQHARVKALLAAMPEVEPQRIFEVGPNGLFQRPQVPETYTWGEVRSVTIGPLTARHWVVRAAAVTDPWTSDLDASSLFVRSGRGKLSFENDHGRPLEIELEPGTLTLVPARIRFQLSADPATTLRVSQQSLPLQTAFGADA